MTRLCIDCAHYLDLGSAPEFGRCGRAVEKPSAVSPVTGAATPAEYRYCSTERRSWASFTTCGPEGECWEPQPDDEPLSWQEQADDAGVPLFGEIP